MNPWDNDIPITENVTDKEIIFTPDDDNGFFQTFYKTIVHDTLSVAKGLVGTAEEGLELLPWVKEENYLTRVGKNIGAEREEWKVTPDSALEWGARVIGGAIPYMGAALVGGMYWGAPGAAAVAFSVEGQDAYEAAKSRGATETAANIERGIVGAINAGLEMVQINKILKFSRSGKGSFQVMKEAIKQKAFRKVAEEGGKLTSQALWNSITEGVTEALQGGVSISAPTILEGKSAVQLDENGNVDVGAILSQVGQAGLAGAVVGPFFSLTKAFIPASVAPTQSSYDKLRQSFLDMNKSDEWKAARLRDLETQYNILSTVPKTGFAKSLDDLHTLAVAANSYEFRGKEEEIISKKKGARKREALEFKKVAETAGKLSHEEIAIQMHIIESGSVKEEFDIGMTNNLYNDLREGIYNTKDPASFEWEEAYSGLNKLTKELVLPEKSEVDALEEVIGKDTADLLRGLIEKNRRANRSLTGKIVDGLHELINLPRATVASFDMSFLGIQGLKVAVRHPILGLKAMASGYKAFLNPDNTKYLRVKHQTNPDFDFVTKKMGVKYYEAGTENTQEQFVGKLAKKVLPFIKPAERGWNAAANELRMGLAFHTINRLRGEGLTMQQWKELGSAINQLTGHGDLKSFKKLAPILNLTLFSSRYYIANAKLALSPFKLVTQGKAAVPALKMIAGTLVADMAFAMGILYLISLIKGVEVELDPKSTDFGKIKVGDTRFEFFGNSHRVARLVTQLISGERKTGEGTFTEVERTEIISRYIQSKLSPISGFTVDVLRGEDYLGQPLSGSTDDILNQIFNRTAPLFIQDMVDYIHYNGLDAPVLYAAPLAFNGITTLTYPVSKSTQAITYKNAKAKEFFGSQWDELGPEVQQYIGLFDSQIEELDRLARQERGNKVPNTKMYKEMRQSEKKIFNGLKPEIQDQLNKLLVNVGGISRLIADGWYLNKTRYQQYQVKVVAELNDVLPMYLDLDLDPVIKRQFVENLIQDSKELIRREIVFQANMEDLSKE
jgi:hypothetical protein